MGRKRGQDEPAGTVPTWSTELTKVAVRAVLGREGRCQFVIPLPDQLQMLRGRRQLVAVDEGCFELSRSSCSPRRMQRDDGSSAPSSSFPAPPPLSLIPEHGPLAIAQPNHAHLLAPQADTRSMLPALARIALDHEARAHLFRCIQKLVSCSSLLKQLKRTHCRLHKHTA